MKDSAERNKEILIEEIEKYSDHPMDYKTAQYLAACRGAYKAICMTEKRDRKDSGGKEEEGLTTLQVRSWMEHLENEDGTQGPHYTMDQVEQYRRSLGINCPIKELYAATNMMYSDYCRVLRKYGVDRIEVYIDLAQAFLDDKDAGVQDKLGAYYEHIVEG